MRGGWLDRVRARLQGAQRSAAVGAEWSGAVAEVWPELQDQVDAHLRRPGTAAVSTWEVAASELARRLIGEEDERRLIDRFSDGLVPTLDALQAPHKALPSALAEGERAGSAARTLAAATRPLVLLPHGLDASLEAGWAKTVAWMDPLLVASPRPDEARAALAAAGPRLAACAREAETTLRAELARLPQAKSPMAGIVDPFERWGDVLCRGIEVETFNAARAFIAAVR
jgi:hypothetical protein